MIKQYVENELYFLLTFADVSKHYPRVHSYVFTGMNLFNDETQDTWYFARLTPTATYRSLDKVPSYERAVEGFHEDRLSLILDIDALKAELEKARQRRLSNSRPQ